MSLICGLFFSMSHVTIDTLYVIVACFSPCHMLYLLLCMSIFLAFPCHMLYLLHCMSVLPVASISHVIIILMCLFKRCIELRGVGPYQFMRCASLLLG